MFLPAVESMLVLRLRCFTSTGQGIELNEFFTSTQGKFQTETGKAWAAEVVKRRAAKGGEADGEARDGKKPRVE